MVSSGQPECFDPRRRQQTVDRTWVLSLAVDGVGRRCYRNTLARDAASRTDWEQTLLEHLERAVALRFHPAARSSRIRTRDPDSGDAGRAHNAVTHARGGIRVHPYIRINIITRVPRDRARWRS